MESLAMNLRTLAVLSAMLLAVAGAAPAQRPPPSGQSASFTLVNRTPTVIRELFATPAGLGNWGQNRLDGRNGNPTSLAPGASYAVRRRTDTMCIFDLRVVFADGKSEERKGVNVCATEEVTIGNATAPAAVDTATGKPADDPSFRLFNRAAVPVTEVYATPTGLGNWGQNRLGATPLPPDNTHLFVLPRDGNCIYDLKVVFADKRAKEQKRKNLCRVAELPVP
jgi:hypothetical protein